MKKAWQTDLKVILLLFFFLLLFFWNVVILGCILLPGDNNRDAIANTYPLKLLTTELIKDGNIPLWNPYTCLGNPLLANAMPMVFFPPDIVFYLFATPLGYSVLLIFYVFLAGLFMYLFMKTINVSRFSALVAAIIFMFNGYFIFHLEFRVLGVISFFPLVFLFLEKALSQKSYVYTAPTGVVLGILFLGHLALAGYILISLFLYYLFHICLIYKERKKFNSLVEPLLIMGTALIIGFAIGSVQLIPTLELLPLSNRTLEEPYHSLNAWGKSTLGAIISFIANSFIPFVFGNGAEGVKMPAVPLLGIDPYPRYYAGIMSLLLAFIAAVFRRDAISKFFTFLACSVVVFLLVIYSPLKSIITSLIPSFYIVLHEQTFFIYFSAFSILAGLGADYLITNRTRVKAQVAKFTKVLAFLWIAALACSITLTALFYFGKDWLIRLGRAYIDNHGAGTTSHPHFLQYYYEKLDYYYVWFLDHFNIFSPIIFMPLLVSMVSIAILMLYSHKEIMKLWLLQVMVTSLIIFDLFYVDMKFLPFVKPELLYPRTSATEFLIQKQQEEIFRVLPGITSEKSLGARSLNHYPSPSYQGTRQLVTPSELAFGSNLLVPYKIQNVGGMESLFLRRYLELVSMIEGKKLNGLKPISFTRLNSPLLDLLNVKYLLSTKEISSDKFKLVLDEDVRVYENLSAMPRAFVVPRVEVIVEARHILEKMKDVRFNPREVVILEENPEGVKNPPQSVEGSVVKITNYSPNEVIIDAQLTGNGFLILADSHYPGWKAYVDGKEKKIYRANYILRSVYLNKGHHQVRFIYDPLSFKIGLYISLITLTLVTIFLSYQAYGYLRNRPKERKTVEEVET